MKAAVIQPRYAMDDDSQDQCFLALIDLLDQCDASMDLIVLPEYSDVPGKVQDKGHYERAVQRHHDTLMKKVIETAARCQALVFVNSAFQTQQGYRNTTYAVAPTGQVVGKYFKAHPAPSEVKGEGQGGIGLDVSYSYTSQPPYVLEIDGVRYGFMTCYDFYFYEAFARIAREQVDIIIGCSLQRTDTHQALEIIGRFLSYQTNAYLIRASVSLGLDSEVGGASMMVSPDGTMLVDMKNDVGIAVCEINPKKKYNKPAGFGGTAKPHYAYMEEGRRPWNYRPAGSAIGLPEGLMPYPRVCAHRGFSAVAPENSMPAFGAAVALGAPEIEFDVWPTKDGEIVSCHDATLDRVSNGRGRIYEHTYKELAGLDFGIRFDPKFSGLPVVRLEEILQKFAAHTIMNIHVKPLSLDEPYPQAILQKMVSLIRQYDCEKYVYFMLEPDEHIQQFKAYAPDIPVCVGHLEARPWDIVERAIALKAEKVQLFKPYFNQSMIDLAHQHGIRCNVFWSDEQEEAEALLKMGVDTLLSNNYQIIANTVKAFMKR